MQIILLEKVQNLGELGDTVKVKPGYARNFLIPQGKAVPATPEYVAEFEARRAELERQQAEVLAAARARAGDLDGRSVTITCKAGDEGKLFGSIGSQDIADAVSASGVEVERSEVVLPGDNIRQLGEYPITIHVHADVTAEIVVQVVPEAAPGQ